MSRKRCLRCFVLVMVLGLTACQGRNPEPNVKANKEEPSGEDREIAKWTEAIRADPNKTYERGELAHARRGAAYDHKGEYDKAIADFTEAIQLYEASKAANVDVRLMETYRARGESYQKKKDYDKAIADFTKSLQPVPGSGKEIGSALMAGGFEAMVLYERGLCYEAKGDHAKAKSDYEAAVKADAGILDLHQDLKEKLKK
jgi:tetratricopeptide (TPR) repeat protein